MKKIASLLMAMAMVFALAACSNNNEKPPVNNDGEEDQKETLTYAVETGSAGEEIALEKGYEITSVDDQAGALREVQSGASDAAIIDLLMASAMTGEGTNYPDLKYTEKLTSEEYGVGCRKGSDLAKFINNVLSEAYADGTLMEIAKTYGVQEAVLEQPAPTDAVEPATDGDIAYIKDKGTLIVGITDFAPMDYKNDAGEWIGFDADLAKLVAEKLGVKIQFIEIEWGNKIMELSGKSIDVAWNGMTLTNDVKNAMECTNAYCSNAQVVVVPGK